MANKILTLFETLQKPAITFGSVTNGAGRICDVIDNTTIRANSGLVFVQIKSGATGPNNGSQYRVYLVRRSDDTTGSPNDISDDSLGTADAAVSTEPSAAECIGAITLTNTANFTFKKSFIIRDLSPKFSIVLWNASGQTVSTTSSDHDLQVVLTNPEVQ